MNANTISLPWCSSGTNGIGGAGGRFAVGVWPLRRPGRGGGETAGPPAAAADRPEQVRMGFLIDANDLAVRGDDLGGEQVVDRHAELPDEEPDAAAEGDPADPDGTRVTEPDRQVVRVDCLRHLTRGEAGLGPRGSPLGVDPQRFLLGEAEHDPPLGRAVPGAAVPAASNGQLEAGVA